MTFFIHTYYLYGEDFGFRDGARFFTGDEPHYLLATQNLVKNHSFFMEKIYGMPYSDMLFALGPGWHASYHLGHFIPIHGIGLPLLLSIPYYFGGTFLAVSTIVLVFAILNVVVFKTCSKFVDRKLAFITTMIFGFTTLIFSYSNQVYSDVIMGLLTLSVLYLSFFTKLSKKNLFVIGFLLGFGILLKVTFLIVILLILTTLIIKLIKNKETKNIPYTLAGGSIFVSVFLWFNYVSFGNPFTFYDYCTTCNANPLDFLGALLFDRYDGLLTFSPILIISFYGIIHAYNKNKQFLITISAIAVFWAVLHSLNSGDVSGEDLPSRYLTTLIPLASVPFACALEKYNKNFLFIGSTILLTVIGFALNLGMTYARYTGLNSANLASKSQLLHTVYQGIEQSFPALSGPFTYNWSNATSLNILYVAIVTTALILPLLVPICKKFKISNVDKKTRF